ncbi:MAG: hypothetical protein ACRDDY_04150 [Clostridium sp.]|uniref:hypothetical protein n=1 Tax=Clostridium sp. TaxID=1506 RepID=UPI003EE79A34
MNYNDVKFFLSRNIHVIQSILNEFGAHSILVSPDFKRMQFGLQGNKSGRAHCIYIDDALTHFDYPNGITEDFIKLVARLLNCDVKSAIAYIQIHMGNSSFITEDNKNERIYEDKPLTEYDDSVLDSYQKCISELFIKDGIPPSVQSVFDIRYSERYNRVLIPIRQKGKLVGVFGRYNEKDITSEYIAKYLPTLAYQKGKVLFPFDVNSDYIRASKTVILVESEKTPMLCYKFGIRNVLALGGNSIKIPQIELLKELGVEKVCIALDKGLEIAYTQLMAIRLKDEGFKVGYVDVENIEYIQHKDCVFDLNNKELIIKTIKDYTVEV